METGGRVALRRVKNRLVQLGVLRPPRGINKEIDLDIIPVGQPRIQEVSGLPERPCGRPSSRKPSTVDRASFIMREEESDFTWDRASGKEKIVPFL